MILPFEIRNRSKPVTTYGLPVGKQWSCICSTICPSYQYLIIFCKNIIIPYNKAKYIRFVSDRERKILYFTGKFDKKEVPDTNFQTGEVIPGKYKTRYSFECYDVTTTSTTTIEEESQTSQPEPSIWERGAADARTLLYYLSKDKNILEVTRNGQPGSTSTIYQINPPLD